MTKQTINTVFQKSCLTKYYVGYIQVSPSAQMPQISSHIDLRPITQGLAIIPRAKSASQMSSGEFSRRNTIKSDSGVVYVVYLIGNERKACFFILLLLYSLFCAVGVRWESFFGGHWEPTVERVKDKKRTWRLLLKPLTWKATKLSPKESSDV